MHAKRQPMLPSPGGGPRLTRNTARSSVPACPRMFSRSLLRRRRFYGLLALIGLAVYYFRILATTPKPVVGYEPYYAAEVKHAMDIAGQERDKVRYVHFKVQSFSRADDALASLFLYAHLAYAANRAYVFDPLEPVPLGKYKMWWSKRSVIPLTAMVDVEANWGAKDDNIKPVSAIGWHHICSYQKRTVIHVTPQDLSEARYNPMTLMSIWTSKLRDLETQCVEVVGDIFTDRVLEFPAIQPLFDMITTSPVLKYYALSDKIHKVASTILPTPSTPASYSITNNTVVLQAHLPPLHISSPLRDNHCSALASLNAPFRSFAHLRDLPTPFKLPAAPNYYAQRCNPTVSELVGRLGITRNAVIDTSSSSGPQLKHVYVVDGPMGLTSLEWADRKRWFEELRFVLTTKHGWESVSWARAGAKAEAVAIDMEIAIRAEAFVGNGFSNFASNIVVLRTARGKPKGTMRFI